VEPNPYYTSDPRLKRIKVTIDELELLAKERSPDDQDAMNDALELICLALGVEQVECRGCASRVSFLRAHLLNGYMCGACWLEHGREVLEYRRAMIRETRAAVAPCQVEELV
jgi:hypothetical protein